MTTRRTGAVVSALTILAIALLWLSPPVGFIACAAILVVVPPWGRSLTERAVISALIVVGVVAIVVPRASTVPLTPMTAHLGLSVVTALAVGLRAFPAMRTPIPKPNRIDVLTGVFVVANSVWLQSAYWGKTNIQVLSGLFHTGWDNSGHFIPFANTIEAGATLWPTVDGSIAWNQWYPSLHTTLYALAQLASQATASIPSRPDLLWPYVQWTTLAFTLAAGALAWMASDLATRGARLLRPTRPTLARHASVVAFLAVVAFMVFGSPAWLFNYGFTNFVLAVTIMVVSAYIAGRDLASARAIGWVLLPLAALAINGIWTPLLVGVLPASIVVWTALWREKRWLAPLWALVSAGLVGGMVYVQTRAIAEVPAGQSGSFLQDLGSASIGMAPFNMGAAFFAPVVALAVAVVLVRSRRIALAVAVAGSSVAVLAFLGVAWYAANLASVPPLMSYYALKVLDALLLMNAPCMAALAGLVLVEAVSVLITKADDARVGARANAALLTIVALGLGTMVFGYVGPRPDALEPNYSAAAGIEAAVQRDRYVNDSLIGEAILSAQAATAPYPDRTAMLWDGSGFLPNLWLAGLHGTMSVQSQSFYAHLPEFPYDEKTVEYVNFAVSLHPRLDLVIAWFRHATGALVEPLATRNPSRVTIVQVPLRSSPLCQECSL